MKFQWDLRKAAKNEKKHHVSLVIAMRCRDADNEASTVFGDPLAITFNDPDNDLHEERHLTFGLSNVRRLLVVVHTQRGDITRIISARLATRQEREIYEEG